MAIMSDQGNPDCFDTALLMGDGMIFVDFSMIFNAWWLQQETIATYFPWVRDSLSITLFLPHSWGKGWHMAGALSRWNMVHALCCHYCTRVPPHQKCRLKRGQVLSLCSVERQITLVRGRMLMHYDFLIMKQQYSDTLFLLFIIVFFYYLIFFFKY